LGEPLTIGAIGEFALILIGLFLATRRSGAATAGTAKADEPVVEPS
jgi:hypothetical protein